MDFYIIVVVLCDWLILPHIKFSKPYHSRYQYFISFGKITFFLYRYIIVFDSSIDEHPGCFYCLTIMNSSAIDISVQGFA